MTTVCPGAGFLGATKAPVKDIIVKLIVGAGQASPSPPVGPALGSKGIKSINFCKEFNARTAHLKPGIPVPVVLRVSGVAASGADRSYTFEFRPPPTSYLLFTAAGVEPNKGRLRGAGAVPSLGSKSTSLLQTITKAHGLSKLSSSPTSLYQAISTHVGAGVLTPAEANIVRNKGSPGTDQPPANLSDSPSASDSLETNSTAQSAKTQASGSSGMTRIASVGTVSLKHVYEIAKLKQSMDVRLAGLPLQSVVRCILKQAASCGICVVP